MLIRALGACRSDATLKANGASICDRGVKGAFEAPNINQMPEGGCWEALITHWAPQLSSGF